MKNNQAWLALLTALLLASVLGGALADGARVFDRADLFSSSEERAIEESIAAFQESTGMDFVVLTAREDYDGSQQQVADAFYEQGGFGLDDEHSGIIYFIDMYDRYHYLSTTGQMIDYMPDVRIDSAIERCKRYLSAGDYAGAVQHMISLVSDYVRSGIPEGQYRYDVVTGQRLTARHKALTTTEMLVCAALAALIGLVVVGSVSSRYKLKGNTYDYNFRQNCALTITGRTDDYVRTTTTRVRKAEPPSGGRGGGGFGGGGGGFGSGVHTSGGSMSHGGGGGRF